MLQSLTIPSSSERQCFCCWLDKAGKRKKASEIIYLIHLLVSGADALNQRGGVRSQKWTMSLAVQVVNFYHWCQARGVCSSTDQGAWWTSGRSDWPLASLLSWLSGLKSLLSRHWESICSPFIVFVFVPGSGTSPVSPLIFPLSGSNWHH